MDGFYNKNNTLTIRPENLLKRSSFIMKTLLMLLLIMLLIPINNVYAAAKINIIQKYQTNKTVYFKWEAVKGSSYYTITRRNVDKNGNISNSGKKSWKSINCYFTDTDPETNTTSKTFCYDISAKNKSGKQIADKSVYIIKIPSCTVTNAKADTSGKVTLQWKKINDIDYYYIQYSEGSDINVSKRITKNVDKNKTSVSIGGLKQGKTYSFRVQGAKERTYNKTKIKSYGWAGRATVKIPFKAVTVTLHNNDGSVYKKNTFKIGSSYVLPSMLNPKGYTFIGWAQKKNIIISESTPYKVPYLAYNVIQNVKNDIHLYAVLSDRSKEKDLNKSQLFSPNISKYKKVIFVGDSRTEIAQKRMNKQFPDYKKRGIDFVAKGGAGCSWLKSYGYDLLLEKINAENKNDKRPIAVVFNLGVNRLTTNGPEYEAQRYIDFYRAKAPELKGKGCKLFIMSVNPLVSAQNVYFNPESRRREDHVRTVNKMLYNSLHTTYIYIDTYNWLLETGFGTNASGSNVESGKDDGLHYTDKTYKRIIWKALKFLETH